MATSFRDRIHSPLSRDEMAKLVDEVHSLIEALEAESSEDGEVAAQVDPHIAGYSVLPERRVTDEEGYGPGEVFDDVTLDASDAPPPDAVAVKAAATATGYATSSFVFEPAALERLERCRSTLVIEFYGRIAQKPLFVGLLKMVFARVGEAVIESAEATRITTVESYEAARAMEMRGAWTKVRPLDRRGSEEKKPKKTRAAKVGELESLKLHRRLESVLGGSDPFLRDQLRRELESTTAVVRAYASALMNGGPQPDAVAAKELGARAKDAKDARESLLQLLKKLG